MTDHDVEQQVEAVLDVLAPKVDVAEILGELGADFVRYPVIRFDYEGHSVMPTDTQLRSLAEQIVTAIRASVRSS